MNKKYLSKKDSARIYRWVRIWLGLSALLALLLVGNSVRNYLYVSRALSIQQARGQLTQCIAKFESDLRGNWTPGESRLKLLTDEMAARHQKTLWMVLRDPDGQVLEQAGAPECQLFTHGEETSHFRTRESLFKVFSSPQGEALAEVFPMYVGRRGLSKEGARTSSRSGPFVIAVEVAVLLKAADPATIWPIRHNFMINIAAALALLLTAGLTAWGIRSYVHGRQLEQQVEIARQVQESLLPRSTTLAEGIELAAQYQPAEEVSGDFYDTFHTKRGLALVIGDVSGKGVPAALLMGVIHGAVRSSAWTESRTEHEKETSELNHLLCERTSGDQFASMFWGYCDVENCAMHYVNAGHCTPILMGLRNGEIEIKRLEEGGPVLGLLSSAAYVQGRVEVQPGDVMVLYSDGLVEATSGSGEEFGESRLVELLSRSHRESPEKIRDAILASVRAFLDGVTAHDDLTCVVARFGPMQS